MQTYKYYRNGKLHRDDGPAIIRPDGTQEWYKEGKLHRDDGPAIVYISGVKYWYKEGKIHKLHKDNRQIFALSTGTRFDKLEKIKCKL